MKRFLTLADFKLVALFCVCTMALPMLRAQEQAVAPDAMTLYTTGFAPGDVIDVTNPDMAEAGNSHFVIGPEGTIAYPYAGVIKIAGLTPEQARQAIIDALKSKQILIDPQISINVASARNYAVTLMGEFKNPQRMTLYGPTPLSIVLAQAGGLTSNANLHILITHASGQMPDDLETRRDLTNTKVYSTLIYPGDVLAAIPSGMYYVLGEFGHTGVLPITGTQHMTMLQAVAQAGGPTTLATLRNFHILRTVDGHREEIVMDLGKLERGEIADPLIHSDDILYLPRSGTKLLTNNWLSTALSLTGLGSTLFYILR